LVALLCGCAATTGQASLGEPRAEVGAADVSTQPVTTAPVTTVPEPVTTMAAPPTTVLPPVPGIGCPPTGRAAVVDRARQRAWLCDGPWRAGPEMAVTTANSQPLPGGYQVYAKDRLTTSRFGAGLSYLDDFVAFSRGRFTGARIAFHAVPRTAAGEYLQPFDTVGALERRGESAGCIRALPDDARRIWDWLGLGDAVVVIS
jgi:hypothetical protein